MLPAMQATFEPDRLRHKQRIFLLLWFISIVGNQIMDYTLFYKSVSKFIDSTRILGTDLSLFFVAKSLGVVIVGPFITRISQGLKYPWSATFLDLLYILFLSILFFTHQLNSFITATMICLISATGLVHANTVAYHAIRATSEPSKSLDTTNLIVLQNFSILIGQFFGAVLSQFPLIYAIGICVISFGPINIFYFSLVKHWPTTYKPIELKFSKLIVDPIISGIRFVVSKNQIVWVFITSGLIAIVTAIMAALVNVALQKEQASGPTTPASVIAFGIAAGIIVTKLLGSKIINRSYRFVASLVIAGLVGTLIPILFSQNIFLVGLMFSINCCATSFLWIKAANIRSRAYDSHELPYVNNFHLANIHTAQILGALLVLPVMKFAFQPAIVICIFILLSSGVILWFRGPDSEFD